MSLLLSTAVELVIKFLALALAAFLAVICGIKVRKYSDKKKLEKEKN